MIQHKRTALLAAGQVQGVGFRPFIYRLAVEGGLSGCVGNTSDGVRIEVQGPPEQVDAFAVRLRRELPPLARLTRLEITELPPVDGETEFVIVASHGHAGHSVLVSPDVGICEDCLRDMHTPGNPRFGYAFTNCTNCGPRYTITRSIPYDRATTSMACFPFCRRHPAPGQRPGKLARPGDPAVGSIHAGCRGTGGRPAAGGPPAGPQGPGGLPAGL